MVMVKLNTGRWSAGCQLVIACALGGASRAGCQREKTFKQIDSKCDVEYDGLVVQLSGAFYGLLQAEVSLAKHSNGKADIAMHCTGFSLAA